MGIRLGGFEGDEFVVARRWQEVGMIWLAARRSGDFGTGALG